MRTIAIINQKGGCGKTTTAINLGACLGRAGVRTLLVDLDSQSHCAAGLGVPDSRIDLDTSDLLRAGPDRAPDRSRLVWRTAKNLDLIPSRTRLAGLESPSSEFARQPQRERALSRVLARFGDEYDVCLLDCPPSIGLIAFNALVAADLVLIPVETSYFSLQGATRQLATVRAVAKRLDTPLRCLVVPTMHEPGLAVADDLLEELRRRFRSRLVGVTVRRDAALREATSYGRPVIEHAPGSTGARDYAALASILIETERVEGGAPEDDDWRDLDAVGDEPLPRPGSANGAEKRPTGRPGDGAIRNSGGLPAGGLVSSVVGAGDAPVGQVIVTLASGETHAGLAQRVQAPAGAPPTRAEELARRTAMPVARPTRPETPEAVTPGPGRRHFGVQVTDTGVLFVQPAALGRDVAVSGDFNNWGATPLRPNEATGTLEVCLPLRAGRHEYRLRVDGHSIADPYNADWVLDASGQPNSLVEVPECQRPGEGVEMCCGAD